MVARFIERSIAGELARLLGPGGTIFCEQSMEGIAEAYCVKRGELASLFPSLEVVLDAVDGDRSVFIGRRKTNSACA